MNETNKTLSTYERALDESLSLSLSMRTHILTQKKKSNSSLKKIIFTSKNVYNLTKIELSFWFIYKMQKEVEKKVDIIILYVGFVVIWLWKSMNLIGICI